MKIFCLLVSLFLLILFIQCNDSSDSNSNKTLEPPKDKDLLVTKREHPLKKYNKEKETLPNSVPQKPRPIFVYESGEEVSLEIFQEFLWKKFQIIQFPEFYIDALIEKELNRRKKIVSDKEIQEILKAQKSQIQKNRNFAQDLANRKMSVDIYLNLLYPRQLYTIARQKIYNILCEEKEISPNPNPDLEMIRAEIEPHFKINRKPEQAGVLFQIDHTSYTENKFKNYLFGQFYLTEMFNFVLSQTAKKYYEQNKLQINPENERKVKETLREDFFRPIRSMEEEKRQQWLELHGTTANQFEAYLDSQAKEKMILITTGEHIQTTDTVLESLFQTKYREVFQSEGQLVGKNTSLCRYTMERNEVARVLYSQEKHEQNLPALIQEKMTLLEKVRQDILDNKLSFSQAVEQYSEDFIEKVKAGGVIGLVDAYSWPKEFYAQVQKLNVGEISPPFQTQEGLFLVQVDEVIPNEMIKARHLLFSPKYVSEKEALNEEHNPEAILQKLMEEAQKAWQTIQSSPDPNETFLEMIRAQNTPDDGIFGPIGRNQIYKSYLKSFEEGKINEIQPPFPTIQGVYMIQPLSMEAGRKCRQLFIPIDYVKRFNLFVRKEANAQIEAKMNEILEFLKNRTPEETGVAYEGWIRLEKMDYYKNQMEPPFEEQFPSMKKGDISKPFWFRDFYIAYQVLDSHQISYQEAKPQLLQELLEANQDPGLRTGPALAKLYPYQFTFYFPYQNKRLEED